jgi:hypothetical protein
MALPLGNSIDTKNVSALNALAEKDGIIVIKNPIDQKPLATFRLQKLAPGEQIESIESKYTYLQLRLYLMELNRKISAAGFKLIPSSPSETTKNAGNMNNAPRNS